MGYPGHYGPRTCRGCGGRFDRRSMFCLGAGNARRYYCAKCRRILRLITKALAVPRADALAAVMRRRGRGEERN